TIFSRDWSSDVCSSDLIVGLTSLRVRADFLAITTMGAVFLFVGVVRQQEWLGGEMGISGIPGSGLDRVEFMWFSLGLAALVAILDRKGVVAGRRWCGWQ